MQFNTLTFLVFFSFAIVTYWLIRNWSSRKSFLLAMSYLFYSAWNPIYVGLIAFSTVLDWWIARRMSIASSPRTRRILLVASLVSNLGLLAFFKYAGFLLSVFTDLMAGIGVVYSPPDYSIVLPVGISFYTFQTLSYTIDVYRKRITELPSLRDFSLYVSFFPQLVAGPIVRASEFLPQIRSPRPFVAEQFHMGIALIIVGLFQKVVLADGILAAVADDVFLMTSGTAGVLDAWAGVLAFGGQIFFDFSGYSTVAIGAALCFGFVIPDNFMKPYSATGFSDFWCRWHISLSSWFRDYLYIPLGGNRQGTRATYRNLMITMLLAGFWHGASWMFVFWGFLHGVFLWLERVSGPRWEAAPVAVRVAVTFVAVHIAWVFFRATDLNAAVTIFAGMMGARGMGELGSAAIIALAIAVMNAAYQVRYRGERVQVTLQRMHWGTRGLLFALLAWLTYLYSGGDERAFIYFQF